MTRVLRVALSDLIAENRQIELDRVFGKTVDLVETIHTSHADQIVDRARQLDVEAIVFDAGTLSTLEAVKVQLLGIPLLRPIRQQVERKREYREGVFSETQEKFVGYGRYDEHGEVEALENGELG